MQSLMKKIAAMILAYTAFMLFMGFTLSSCEKETDLFEEGNGTVRYNSLVFGNASLSRDISYGQSTTQGGTNQDLLMDIYEPEGDTESSRPVVVFAHGGGFQGGTKEDNSDLATYLARSGYVVASINYRLVDVEPNATVMTRSVLDAVQDMKAAVRFLKKDAATAQQYRIDPDKIFLSGYSAGAFMSLHYAYLTTEAEVTSAMGSEYMDYLNQSGGLEGNSGNAGYSTEVRGVINIAGALIRADLVDQGEPALFSVHGTDDSVVPFMEGVSDDSGVTTQGSGMIHPEADNEGVTNTLKTITGGAHDAFFQCSECASELRAFVYENL